MAKREQRSLKKVGRQKDIPLPVDAEFSAMASASIVGVDEGQLPNKRRSRAQNEIRDGEGLAQLTRHERFWCLWKQLGFPSHEIARKEGISVARANALFNQIKRKVRRTSH
jgi:hypothetical protein